MHLKPAPIAPQSSGTHSHPQIDPQGDPQLTPNEMRVQAIRETIELVDAETTRDVVEHARRAHAAIDAAAHERLRELEEEAHRLRLETGDVAATAMTTRLAPDEYELRQMAADVAEHERTRPRTRRAVRDDPQA